MTNGILMREEVFREVRFNMEGSKSDENLKGQPLSSPT